nr:hypothetical protein [Kineosporia corallincola]
MELEVDEVLPDELDFESLEELDDFVSEDEELLEDESEVDADEVLLVEPRESLR